MFCKYCGNMISDTSRFCDHCGRSTSEGNTPVEFEQKRTFEENRKKNIVGLILGVFAGLMVFAAIMVAISGPDSSKDSSPQSDAYASTPPANSKEYSEGTYKVGVDIEPGEYYVYCNSPISCYFSVSSDSSGTVGSIVTNDNINTFAFVTVSDGQYLNVTRGAFMKATDATVPGADSAGNYGAGMYRVGTDIPAGEYKVTCTNSVGCYLEVSKDSFGLLSSIVANDNIDTFTYITVSNGQYLTVVGGQFAPAQ